MRPTKQDKTQMGAPSYASGADSARGFDDLDDVSAEADTKDGVATLSDEELLEDARERFEKCEKHWKDIHAAYRDDTRFAAGDQWDERIVRLRTQENRSVLKYDKINAFVRRIVNQARMNTPAIKISPAGGEASEQTAKILDGLVKYIEYDSFASSCYSSALKQIVVGGIGAWRVLPQEDEAGQPQIMIDKISDPTTVMIDPASKKPGFCDADYGFVTSWVDKDQFEQDYPGVSTEPFDKRATGWFTKDKVQIVEYWYRHGSKYNQALLCGNAILNRDDEYKGIYLPIVLITGEEYIMDGLVEYKGIVRDIKDVQRMINYTKSEIADYLARSAKSQWLVPSDCIEDFQEFWNESNIHSTTYMPYRVGAGGSKPERIDPVPPPAGLIQSAQEADMDMRAAIGIRDPNEDVPAGQSGKAIGLQITEGNVGTFNYFDSLHIGIRYCAKVILDLIPYYYDYQHVAQIMGADGAVTTVPIQQPTIDGQTGEQIIHNLSAGKYNVRLSTGPNFESQRQETVERLVDLVQKYPQMMQLAGDIIVKNLNFAGADELAARLHASIPAPILQATAQSGEQKGQAAMAAVPQLQQQLQQLQQENQMLKQQMATKQTELQTKYNLEMQKDRAKFEQDAQLRQLDMQADMATEAAKAKHQENMQHADVHARLFQEQMKHDLGQHAADQQHSRAMDQQRMQHGFSQQATQLGHALDKDKMTHQQSLAPKFNTGNPKR